MSPFTLNELLIVVTVLAVIAAIAVPVVLRMQQSARAAACRDSLQSLTKAATIYVNDHSRYMPASTGQYTRWYGSRAIGDNLITSDLTGGPLTPYLNRVAKPTMCPELEQMIDKNQFSREPGGWGFGYNRALGNRAYTTSKHDFWSPECESLGLRQNVVKSPDKTLFFADTATYTDSSGEFCRLGNVAAYGFSHAVLFVNRGKPSWGTQLPTTHFRHLQQANTAWADGHIETTDFQFSKDDWSRLWLGYVGDKDNSAYNPVKE